MLHTYIETFDYQPACSSRRATSTVSRRSTSKELDDAIWLGDLKPAQVIYDLYLKRVEARVAKIKKMLETEKFDFDGHGTIEISRLKAPWPKDEADADRLWHDRIENELLTERLAEAAEVEKKPVKAPDSEAKTPPATRERSRRTSSTRRTRWPPKAGDKPETNRRQALRPAAAFAPRADQGGRGQVFPQRPRPMLRPAQRIHEPERDGKFLHQHASVAHRHRRGPAQGGRISPRSSNSSPAARPPSQGDLKVDDKIAAVAQGNEPFVDVVDMKLDKVVETDSRQEGDHRTLAGHRGRHER